MLVNKTPTTHSDPEILGGTPVFVGTKQAIAARANIEISPFTTRQLKKAKDLVQGIEVDLDGDLGEDYRMP